MPLLENNITATVFELCFQVAQGFRRVGQVDSLVGTDVTSSFAQLNVSRSESDWRVAGGQKM